MICYNRVKLEATRQGQKVAEASFPLVITDSLVVSEASLAVKGGGEDDDVSHSLTFPQELASPPSLDGATSLQARVCCLIDALKAIT